MASNYQRPAIFSDFDGTITRTDTLVFLLDNFGAPNWWDIEMRLMRGELNEREALRMEIDSLRIDWDTAMQALYDNIDIDPGFPNYLKWIQSKEIPFMVLSGGFEEISGALLRKHNLNGFEIRANTIEIQNDRWKVVPSQRPRIKGLCNNCKTFPLMEMKKAGVKTIYIGDGNTDRCAAENADIVFAKKDLADYLEQKRIPFYNYSDFNDILRIVKAMVE